MEYINSLIEGIVNLLTSLSVVFNRIPWDTIINGLLGKLM